MGFSFSAYRNAQKVSSKNDFKIQRSENNFLFFQEDVKKVLIYLTWLSIISQILQRRSFQTICFDIINKKIKKDEKRIPSFFNN